jgi:hypothetical protein
VEIEVQPEPTDEERAALLEALAGPAAVATASLDGEWRRVALLEATGADEP